MNVAAPRSLHWLKNFWRDVGFFDAPSFSLCQTTLSESYGCFHKSSRSEKQLSPANLTFANSFSVPE